MSASEIFDIPISRQAPVFDLPIAITSDVPQFDIPICDPMFVEPGGTALVVNLNGGLTAPVFLDENDNLVFYDEFNNPALVATDGLNLTVYLADDTTVSVPLTEL